MMKTIAALIAFLTLLTGATFQEFEEEKDGKKQDEGNKGDPKKKEEAAKAAVKAYQETRKKAKSDDDHISAIDSLAEADAHPLILKELLAVLESQFAPTVRAAGAKGMRKYKKNPLASDALIRNARTQKDEDLRKTCLKSFGEIAPFGKSVELQSIFPDEAHAVVKAAVEAVEAIKSVRMIRPLTDLLGELERIREDDGGDRGPGVPGGGSGQQGDKEQRKKRKSELLTPTLGAINALWGKVDTKLSFKKYADANRALIDHRAAVKKTQDEEDKADKTP